MKLVGKRVLVIDLEEEAESLMKHIREIYGDILEDGDIELNMDFIQETSVYDNYTHDYNEYLYVYIRDHLDELKKILDE